jgi:S-adenosyl methyltransferase
MHQLIDHERCAVNNTRSGLSGELDINRPNIARVYDFLLGGAHNFASDRMLAATIERTVPYVRDIVRLNRAFLGRAVNFMIDAGIRQFLDIGSGIPTVGNVHEIAQARDPECRVVYVDKESVAVTHSLQLLRDNDRATAIQADVRDPEDIVGRPETTALLDFDRPVGLLMLLLWHFVPDSDDPYGLLARYHGFLASGSCQAITHLTDDNKPKGVAEAVDEAVRRGIDDPTPRTHEQVVRMFTGFELVEPGVVGTAAWRPAGPVDVAPDPAAGTLIYAGVGRKP